MGEVPWNLLLASALAGSLARIPTHPLDTLKARMMASKGSTLRNVLNDTLKTEGVRGLYRGFWFTTVSSIPASCTYFSSQEWSRKKLFSNSLASGFFAETVSCLLYVPIDVVKERMQVARMDAETKTYGSRYDRGIQAIRSIVSTEGVKGLYKGYLSTLASFGPFSALYFFFYEDFRKRLEIRYQHQESIPAYAFWAGGGLCGAAAAFLTTPLDLVKLRKQLDPSSSFYVSEGMVAGLRRTLKDEGLPGLFRGATARVLFFSPTTAFSMAIFEVLRASL